MENDLPHDAVERVREIRNRHYEETKHMTREELRAHNQKRYEEAEKWFASVKPNPSRFPFLAKK
jgi:hypothetical protein